MGALLYWPPFQGVLREEVMEEEAWSGWLSAGPVGDEAEKIEQETAACWTDGFGRIGFRFYCLPVRGTQTGLSGSFPHAVDLHGFIHF